MKSPLLLGGRGLHMFVEELDSVVKTLKDAEVYVITTETRKTDVENNKVVDSGSGKSSYVAVRVSRGKRVGFASSTLSSDLRKTVEELYKKAEKVASVQPEVPWWEGFPSGSCSAVSGLYSEALASSGLEALVELAERALSNVDKEKYYLDAHFNLSVVNWAVANTEGVRYEERSTNASAVVALAKKVGDRMTKHVVEQDFSHARMPNVEALVSEALKYAERLVLKPRKVVGEKVVVLEPTAAAELLDFVAEAFYADSVATGNSPLAGKLGEKAFGEQLTVSDNPTLPGGPSSHGCDTEGVKSEVLVLIDEGVVKGYLGDLYWGYKVGFVGRGYRESPNSPPSPAYTNLTVHAGKGADGDVRVLGLTGLHTASPETGIMSVVLSPAFEGDEHVEAVLSGNVYDFLGERLEGVGTEGRWVWDVFTPAIAFRAELH